MGEKFGGLWGVRLRSSVGEACGVIHATHTDKTQTCTRWVLHPNQNQVPNALETGDSKQAPGHVGLSWVLGGGNFVAFCCVVLRPCVTLGSGRCCYKHDDDLR